MNTNTKEVRERCETLIEIEAREEACVPRIVGVDDGELEKSEEAGGTGGVWRKEHLDNQANRKESNTRCRIFLSAVGADVA